MKLSFDEIIKLSKTMKPKFPPGKKGKAFYSDTNFQLLGQIVETVSGLSLSEAYKEYILNPLGLKKTYLYGDINDTAPASFYYKDKIVTMPKAMTSFTSNGGIVSTAEENMIFLKAFFNGELFSKDNFNEMKVWNRIYPPFQYGMGLARFHFFGAYELIGHPGASGSFAYYCPNKNAYITGTINQIHKPSFSYKLIMRVLKTIPK
jgi:CubicO group peptidase (beta-lactamase class C family)